ncbi:copper transporter 1-like [Euphorbia lathyris]|uniref:copper transporter 1-like n=1 Tax=Euphorbia lathyris TaxID=212925 RepID=UPI003314077D
MNHGNHNDMSSMNMNNNSTGGMPSHHKMMMHMTFYWGKDALILFSGWPGTRSGMYVLALILVFVLSFLVEFLSQCQIIKPGSSDFTAGVIQTLMHALRVGLAYMVMLAIMSFNGGVFLVAVAGHTLGFLLFGSRLFKKISPTIKTSDLPPMRC